MFALLEVLLDDSEGADNVTAGAFEVPPNNPVKDEEFEELFGPANVEPPDVPDDPPEIPLNNVFDPIILVALIWLGWSVLLLMKLVNGLATVVFCV